MKIRDLRRITGIVAAAGVMMCGPASEASGGSALKRGVDSLRRSQLPSGLFRYDFDVTTGQPTGEDNAVRQAAVAAVLAEYFVATRDASVLPTVRLALERFDALSLPLSKGRMQRFIEWTGLLKVPRGRHKLAWALDGLGVLYRPDGDGAVLSLQREYANAWAGATALALFSELHYGEGTGDARFEPARLRWLRGLAALHVAGLGFRVAPTMIHVSPYFDGEGWLALGHYERRYPGAATVREILPALENRLMSEYGRTFSIQFYQWGVMAAATRWDTTKDARFARFVEQQTVETLKWVATAQRDSTCATVEGLATAARVLRDEAGRPPTALHELDARIDDEMRKNEQLQIRPRSGRFDVADGVSIASAHLEELDGAFLHYRAQPYTRIDFTQHCVSAMLKRRPRSSSG